MTDQGPVEFVPDQNFPSDPDAAAQQPLFSRSICIHNDKGGVGKTGLATNLAGILAEADYQVLLVDMDPQGNCADLLGVANTTDRGRALTEHIMAATPKGDLPVVEVRPGLDLAVGGSWLRRVDSTLWEQEHGRPINPYYLLSRCLATVAEDYDLILIDTPPEESDRLWAALGAAHWLLIPTRDDILSIRGLEAVVTRFELARQYNPDLQALGAILTQVAVSATRMRRDARNELAKILGSDLLFDTVIRTAAKPVTLSSKSGKLAHELAADVEKIDVFSYLRQGKPVPDRADSAPGLALDYFRITDELLKRLHDHENAEETQS